MRRTFIALFILCFSGVVAATTVWRVFAQTAAPVISNVTVTNVTATSTTVSWTTDQRTDSFVDFSLDANYCGIRNQGALTTAHTVVIPNLDAATTYFFRIRATNVGGDQNFSGDYTFTTSSTVDLSKVKNSAQAQLAAQAISSIQQITNAAALQAVSQALNTQAEESIGPPQILGNPQLDIASGQVTVTWNTDQDADGTVFISSDTEYNGSSYAREEQDPNGNSKIHTVVVAGLSPATKYHYQVSSKSAGIGAAGTSADLTFTTKATLPDIINPHVVKTGEHEATISWGTSVPSAGNVTYTNMSTRKALSTGDPNYLVTHIIQLTNLVFQSRYSAVITAQNQAGDTVTSQPVYFVTTKNIYPPVISNVTNDSTLYPGQDNTVQTVISWQTDEPSECYLSYVSGVVKNSAETVSSSAETAPLSKHVNVITNFSPATVYKYWVTCGDADGNSTSSEDFVLLTPQQQKSIVDIILDNFKGTFGWVNGIGGKKK